MGRLFNSSREGKGEAKQKVILITGASSGFGQACARHLSQSGYRVYGTSRRAKYDQSIESVPGGHAYQMIPMDVCNQDSINDAVKHILSRDGRIDVLVNNAGIAVADSVEDTSLEEAKQQFDTNFFGTLRVCRAVLPTMRQQEYGYILNISSIAGLMGIPFQGLYSAAKYAIEGLSEALRMEVKPFRVHVVLVEPGDFCTNLTRNRIHAAGSGQNSAYAETYQSALSLMEAKEEGGPQPEKLALLVEKIIQTESPRVRYTIGKIDQTLSVFVKRLVPAGFFEKLMMDYYRLPKSR